MTYVFMTIRPIGIRLPKDFMNFVFVRAPTVVPKIHDYYITNRNWLRSTNSDRPVELVQNCCVRPTGVTRSKWLVGTTVLTLTRNQLDSVIGIMYHSHNKYIFFNVIFNVMITIL